MSTELDAERYQYLRDLALSSELEAFVALSQIDFTVKTEAAVDALIDAARVVPYSKAWYMQQARLSGRM